MFIVISLHLMNKLNIMTWIEDESLECFSLVKQDNLVSKRNAAFSSLVFLLEHAH